MVSKGNRTLKDILDIILYENPATQQEIADKLGITRRYVTQLIRPLVNDGTIKRAYMIDLDKYEKIAENFEDNINSPQHSGNMLITGMLSSMKTHVQNELKLSVESLLENDYDKAEEALKMDYTTNNMFEKIRTSVETVVSINQQSHFSKTVVYNEIAYDLERIGDYCGHIAKFVVNDVYEADEEMLKYIKKMYQINDKMIEYSMDAFLNGNIELKGEIMDLKEHIHELQKISIGQIATQMAETSFDDKERSNYYIYLSRVVKAFERIGDISVEISDTAGEFHKNIPRTITPRTFREGS
ncbi:PhoU family transcriptional regulator [Methanobrevibacter sp. 87.7]|uniref:PhoU domain-containing protein n=1 Tax=Methanobrevibacter sp. 87.7 TaxID=387957 RepID=UPI000B5006D5|nr:PhoU domain-containing protein [Methanobrevibacter sp. 87.7]OWT33047.1 PhoU family transcriptional regulator [Methanobrevibacter sp. 87.7]